ncbi:MAG: penicillin-binding protein A [Tissierellia bacterium]|nr:penicillin-binding protein A [Tissierellia bacterium]
MNKELRRILIILTSICTLFVSLIVYMSYFQIFRAEAVKNNSYNKRLWIDEEKILRGSIIDRNGKILAYSEKSNDDIYKRFYNYGGLYSHIIGYSYREYGKVGLELEYNNILLNIDETTPFHELKSIVKPNTEGNTLKLTIDHHLQEYSRGLLGGKKGAIVAMDPKTAEVYAMVSFPDFNLSNLREEWNDIMEDEDKPFFNRATSGAYIPGSTFKVLTAMAILEDLDPNSQYECTGSVTIDGRTINDYEGRAHGKVNLEEALVKSCNSYFASKGVQVGKDRLGKLAGDFMINRQIPFDIPAAISTFPNKENLGKVDIAAASIGQGKVLMTPLNMALVVSGIANKGEVLQPTLVKEIISPEGEIIQNNEMEKISNGVSIFTANEIKNMMVEVVRRGTGTNAGIQNTRVAGKTGTAENPSGKSHAWFAGFAPADDPRIAVVVVLEEAGSTGGKAAAPIARNIMVEALNTLE